MVLALCADPGALASCKEQSCAQRVHSRLLLQLPKVNFVRTCLLLSQGDSLCQKHDAAAGLALQQQPGELQRNPSLACACGQDYDVVSAGTCCCDQSLLIVPQRGIDHLKFPHCSLPA